MRQTTRIAILNGHLIDPANARDEQADLYIAAGQIQAIGDKPPGFEPEQFIDAKGLIVCPGLIDLSANLREPGFEHKATIASETLAAAKSGITTLCCSPETNPVTDTPAVVELIRRMAIRSGKAMVLPVGAMTQELAGETISEMAALQEAGCIAISQGYRPLKNTLVERRALEYAVTYGLTVFLRPEDRHLCDQGCVHEGPVANRLGLPGIPSAAEYVAVARDLALAEQTGARIHFRAISTATAVKMIRRAQNDGLPVTADVAAHHLHLTELDVDSFNSQCHVRPPLRTPQDRDGLREGLANGTICAICSDHQPHEADAKLAPFPSTAPGISALETLLPLSLKLVEQRLLTLPEAIARLTSGPASVIGLDVGTLAPGKQADICIFDPDAQWQLDENTMFSAGHNTPFLGWHFTGQVTHTLFEGRIVYQKS